MGKPEELKWLGAACDLLDATQAFERTAPDVWDTNNVLLPHVRAVRQHARSVGVPESLRKVLLRAAFYLHIMDQYEEACEWYADVLALTLEKRGLQDEEVALHRSNLAIFLLEAGKLTEAQQQAEMALELRLRMFGPDHEAVIDTGQTLASIFTLAGKRREEINQRQVILEFQRRHLAPDDMGVKWTFEGIVDSLRELGEDREMLKQFERALDAEIKHWGTDDLRVAERREQIAESLRSLGEYPEGLAQWDLALDIRRRIFPADHPKIRTAEYCRKLLFGTTEETQ